MTARIDVTIVFLLAVVLFSVTSSVEAASDDTRKNIVLIAGLKSHGPEGNGIHDYAWSARLIKTMLENSNIRDQVNVSMHLNGWPTDPKLLQQADTIMISSDGRDGEHGREAPHLATPHRAREVDALMKKGCGLVTFHFSTFAPDKYAEQVLDWCGGYFDWETEGKREWYSDIKTIKATVRPAVERHAVLNGIQPFEIREEFYYDIRFRNRDPRWTPIWNVDDLPATKPQGQVVSWAVERANGGRGFGTTCGHFYDNWQHAGFRKTILNALAWTAHIPVPEKGVESEFFARAAIARHLKEGDLVDPAQVDADETVYKDEPYWYKPGHPVDPAESAAIKTLTGFQTEQVLRVPEEFGSWTALAVDHKGRLITAAQHRPGLYRVTLPPIGDESAQTKVERLRGAAEKLGWSQGLLYAFDSLYVTISNEEDESASGLYRLRDTNDDDQFDEVRKLVTVAAAGEHGPHNLVVGPQGKTLYWMCGNGCPLPEKMQHRRPVSTTGIDHLMPPGFKSPEYTAAGYVCQLNPDGSNLRLITNGLRNSFDLAFNRQGDLFTFDSDMEWDIGSPWYRPTRICHLVSGGEFGWRPDEGKWPAYYEDSVRPVLNIGPGSPTGVTFGYGTKFPAKYQRALFACDWTFATIHAVHLEPHGASYRATVEEFVGGRGLPVTDIVVGVDGSLYFTVGGRRLGSAIYRIRYVGGEPNDSIESEPLPKISPLHALRRSLEARHGNVDPQTVEAVWPYLAHPDHAIRFAARVALETQPVESWRWNAFWQLDIDIASTIPALLALARQDAVFAQPWVIEGLRHLDIAALSRDQRLQVLRVYELALARGGENIRDEFPSIRRKLRPLLPDEDPQVNRELTRVLCFVGDATIIEPVLALMDADAGSRPDLGSGYFVRNDKYGQAVRDILEAAPMIDRMHHAQMLLWIDDGWTNAQRKRYFELVSHARQHSKGGRWYEQFWERIHTAALNQLPENRRDQFRSIRPALVAATVAGLPKPQGPGRAWTLEAALQAVQQDFRSRDFANGKKMFSAAACATCHRFNGQGNAIGPDLSSIGQRFTLRDILDSTLNPSKAVSDQYRVTMVVTTAGQAYSGRIISRDNETIKIATDLNRPTEGITVATSDIDLINPVPVSTMPTRSLDPLNRDELLDLLAYLISGGGEEHPIFGRHTEQE